MAKAVAKKAEKGGLPAEFEAELLEDAGEFEEHLQQADMAIPFLQVIQAQSPQVTEGDAQFIKEAVKGMLFNTVTKKCYDGREEGVMIVPIKYKRSFIEWVRREDGGGFVAEHPPEESGNLHTKLNEDRQDIIQEGSRLGVPGHQIVETATHFVMLIDPETGDGTPCVLSMSSSQFKVSRNWNSQIATRVVQTSKGKVKPPRFFDAWRLKTVVLTNDEGTWYGYDLQNEGTTHDTFESGAEIYEACKTFSRSLKSGEKKADYSKAPGNGGNEAAGGDPDKDDEIPF